MDETPRPKIKTACVVCSVLPDHITENQVIVSPSGKAHMGKEYGMSACGKDATGGRWWWPL